MTQFEDTYFELFRNSLNVDFDEKDEELRFLLKSAFEFCIRETNRTAEDLEQEGGGELPTNFVHAAIILAKHWWETGGTMVSTSMRENPAGFECLLKPFIYHE